MEGQTSAASSARQRDPLLALARLAFGFVTGISLVAAVAFCLAVPFVLLIRDKVLAWLVAQGAPPEAIWGVVMLQLLAAAAGIFAFYFFRNLYRIIDTVGDGDPFVPENASRLMAMGWISIASHVLAIPLNLVSQWLRHFSDRFHVEFGLSLAGVLLALILFVLARVFREGARMRDELEGTV
ncbi:MAG: DUF2975 domain-containing protein [Novosphingobium sp.]|nr:DUF2975 domain-containing protein [Novosphingobium sp.]MCP5401657.1 DUF2975 domain-containing protein [Novosphingobium sp.]